MKKTTILSIVVLLIVSVSSISYSVLLHKENRALIAKQDSLYTLSDAYSGGYPFSISGDIRSVPS